MLTDRGARLALSFVVVAALATPSVATAQTMDSQLHGFALADRLEVAPNREGTPITLDAIGWYGGDVNRAWVRAEADQETESSSGEGELELFYGRLVSPYWDALVGVRVDQLWGGKRETRAHLALGLEGVAPHWFELEPTLYVSHEGHVSAQLEAEYELLFTQRVVLQPRFEISAAANDDPEFGVGAGIGDVEFGARLRYEIVREFAPYMGVSWHRLVGNTADLARSVGEDVSNLSVVVGVRAWY